MNDDWLGLYNKAVEACNEREVSDTVFVGSVAAAILSKESNVYIGVSVDMACSIGFCAERNAIGQMLTKNDEIILKMVAVKNDKIIMPCGVCREFMMQMQNENYDIEVLSSLNPLEVLKLNDLSPNYWKD